MSLTIVPEVRATVGQAFWLVILLALAGAGFVEWRQENALQTRAAHAYQARHADLGERVAQARNVGRAAYWAHRMRDCVSTGESALDVTSASEQRCTRQLARLNASVGPQLKQLGFVGLD